mgnify:FL=1
MYAAEPCAPFEDNFEGENLVGDCVRLKPLPDRFE